MFRSSVRSRRLTRAAGSRSGLSLLEVLFSIFIISIGMLGAAMLVVVGNQYAAEANIKDRAASCGYAALQQMIARGMIAPQGWFVPAGAPNVSAYQPVVMDPLYLYGPNGSSAPVFRMAINVRRITWRPIHGNTGRQLADRIALAESIFRWQDDLVFDPPPGDANGRPLPITHRPTAGTVPPPLEASEGQFSWMAMIQPAWQTTNPMLGRLWRVTVVVFARRNLAEQEVRIPDASFPGASVQFYPPGNNLLLTNPPDEMRSRLLPDRWILLSVRHPTGGGVVFYHWYRIVSATELGGTGQWLLRLDGPRWPYAAGGSQVTATVVPDVVAVYDRTVVFDPGF